MQNPSRTTSAGEGAAVGSAKKESLRSRALHELKDYAIITLYLWVLFVLLASTKGSSFARTGSASGTRASPSSTR